MPLVRTARTLVLVTGAALLARRAVRRRIERAPLWPLPALETPMSGRPRTRSFHAVVTERTQPAWNVVQLRLEAAELPAWRPGAHVDVILPSGLVRQYSLCGDPTETGTYTIATRLVEDGRGGSREVHERLRTGAGVEIRGPRNRFPLVDAEAYVFVAGGIGITPILPMLRELAARGADWRLLYGGRTRASMPYVDELEKLGAEGGRVSVVADDESGPPDLAAHLEGTAPGTAVYCCGPGPLMDAVAALRPDSCTLHTERFTPGTASLGAASPGGSFEVELRRTGRVVRVPVDRSVLAAVREELPNVAYSCEQGFCGTCQQRVLAGDIERRDEVLTDAERADSMLICVSRSRGERLILDL
ncbi:PDR/VanB family oxidoreductase [Streptomyces sp. NPDC096176]|uniref:PDR/VanB family oxidoreductase n=1 Tax=Streptomyces sp. NPDC096176 TaxID=3366079 RepID=UPI0038045F0F